MRAVLAAVYDRLDQPLPLSFALCDGPIVLPLRPLDWRLFEDFEQVPKCVSAYVIELVSGQGEGTLIVLQGPLSTLLFRRARA